MRNRRVQKPLALLLAMMMVMGLFPAAAAAAPPAGPEAQALIISDAAVPALTGGDDSETYAYFKTANPSSALNWGLPYGEVTLRLYSKTQSGVDDELNPVWSVAPIAHASVYSNGVQAYTPGGEYAVTDDENGMVTITLWGGAAADTYFFDISAAVDGAAPAHCRATMVYDGTNAPTLSFDVPGAKDTSLFALTLTFPEAPPSSGLSYVGTGGMSVGNAVESVALAAAAHAPGAAVTATYQAAGHGASAYTPGDSAALAVGNNTFKLTVTNGEDRQIHTLVLTRKAAGERNIPVEAEAVKNGVKTVTGDAPYTDWVLAMNAAGLALTEAQLETYLAAVLTKVTGTGNTPAQIAKIAMALTALGIDARQIPDPHGGAAIDLIQAAAAYDVKADDDSMYSAPYLLSLYDLGNYEIPAGAKSTRTELINAILGAEGAWTAWGYDGVGIVLPALAPYYGAAAPVNGISLATCQEITEAVDRALGLLSAAQTVDGGFGAPNSNTVSTVITGLSAIGVNAHTDSRFVKSGTSLLMNLLSFRTAENMLGFADGASANILASIQGFQALAVWQNLTNPRSGNLYHFTKEIAPYTSWPDAQLLTGIAVTTPPATRTYSLGAAETAPDTTGIVVTATYNADVSKTEVISISDCTVSAVDCRTAGTKTVTVSYQGKTATFLVTVLNANGTAPRESTVSIAVQNGSKLLAKSSRLVIQGGETSALDVLKTVLNQAGKAYVIRNGAYVAEIDGVGEFDQGANSGWLYSVNGVTPQATAAGDYTLSDGDTVLWYYTLNYTTDSSASPWTRPAQRETLTPGAVVADGAASAAVSDKDMAAVIAAVRQNNSAELVIEPKITEAVARVSLVLPKASLAELSAETAAGLRVQTPVGSVTIPKGALGSIAAQAAGSTVTISFASVNQDSLTGAQREAVGDKSVFDISVQSGGHPITGFGGGTLTVSLPYVLKDGEEASGVAVWHLDSAGKLQRITAAYDAKTGLATFVTPQLSLYAVGHTAPWQNPFSDVGAADWFYDAAVRAVQRGLFRGTSDVTFAPNETMTRAMLVTVLFRLEGSPAVTGDDGFGDVQSGQWYSDAVTWASANQIVSGYGGGRYGVNDPVTREQLAAILYRYAGYRGDDVTKTAELGRYTDAAAISPWAEEAMGWANAGGLMAGTTATTLAPTERATRAQVATILMRFLEA